MGCTHPHSPVPVGALGTPLCGGFLGSGPGTAPLVSADPAARRVDGRPVPQALPQGGHHPSHSVLPRTEGGGEAGGRVGGALTGGRGLGWEAGALTAGALASGSPACPQTCTQSPPGPSERAPGWLPGVLTTCGDPEGVLGWGSWETWWPVCVVTVELEAKGGGWWSRCGWGLAGLEVHGRGAGTALAGGGRALSRQGEGAGTAQAGGGAVPLSLPVPLQVVQPDPEEAGGLQGAGEGAHLSGDCCEDAGECSLPARPPFRGCRTPPPGLEQVAPRAAGASVCRDPPGAPPAP